MAQLDILSRLMRSPLRALSNWPWMLALVANGWVHREPVAENARWSVFRITESGRIHFLFEEKRRKAA